MRGKVLGLTYHISSLYNTNKFLDSKSPVICGSRAGLFAVWNKAMFLSPLPSESNLRMTSMQIAELCGKEHKHVLADIDSLVTEIHSAENPAEWDNVIIEQRARKSKRGEVRYFELDENAALNVVSGYNRTLRNRIIKEWRFYREAFNDRQWRHADIAVQQRVMATLQAVLEYKADRIDYIKANTIVNKAVSNLYGFEKMINKDEMSRPMLDDRQRILEDFEKLFSVKQDYGWVKETLYELNRPKRLS